MSSTNRLRFAKFMDMDIYKNAKKRKIHVSSKSEKLIEELFVVGYKSSFETLRIDLSDTWKEC